MGRWGWVGVRLGDLRGLSQPSNYLFNIWPTRRLKQVTAVKHASSDKE